MATSAFTWVLPRVRSMREQRDWPPTTTPATQEQRRERVLQARRRILYRPEPFEVAPESARPAWRRLLWYVVPFALVATAMAWVMLAIDSIDRDTGRSFSYQLPRAPSFLSERLAITVAKQSLSDVVSDPTAWTPLQSQDRKAGTAPDGTRDMYLHRLNPADPNSGIIFFTSAAHPNEEWCVSVQLRGAQLSGTVSRSR